MLWIRLETSYSVPKHNLHLFFWPWMISCSRSSRIGWTDPCWSKLQHLQTEYWGIQNTGEYRILRNTEYWGEQNTEEYRIRKKTKYWWTQNTEAYRILMNTEYSLWKLLPKACGCNSFFMLGHRGVMCGQMSWQVNYIINWLVWFCEISSHLNKDNTYYHTHIYLPGVLSSQGNLHPTVLVILCFAQSENLYLGRTNSQIRDTHYSHYEEDGSGVKNI